MKQWKKEIVDAIVAETEHSRIISFKQVAQSLGHPRLNSEDVRFIMWTVLKAAPDYKPIRFMSMDRPYESLFNSLHFVENVVEFDDGEETEVK